MVLFLAVTAKNQSIAQKIKNFFTKWRDVKNSTSLCPADKNRARFGVSQNRAPNVFMLLLDGKLRSRTENLKFLKPFAPPPISHRRPHPAAGRGSRSLRQQHLCSPWRTASQRKVKARRLPQ